jgi:hypothetical protein
MVYLAYVARLTSILQITASGVIPGESDLSVPTRLARQLWQAAFREGMRVHCSPTGSLILFIAWSPPLEGNFLWGEFPKQVMAAKLTIFWPREVTLFPRLNHGYGHLSKPWDRYVTRDPIKLASTIRRPCKLDWGMFTLRAIASTCSDHLVFLAKIPELIKLYLPNDLLAASVLLQSGRPVALTLTGEILLTTTDTLPGKGKPIVLPTPSAKAWAAFINSCCQQSAEFHADYMRFIHADESDEPPGRRENQAAASVPPYVPPPTYSASFPIVPQAVSPASLYDYTEILPGIPRAQELLRKLDEFITAFLQQPIGSWNPPPEMGTSTQNFYRGRISSFLNKANLLLTGLPPKWKPNSSIEDLFGSQRFR